MPKTAKLKQTYASALKSEIKKIGPRPKVADIGTNFIRAAGGAKNFASMLWKEFNAADAGSLARQRILGLIFLALKQDDDDFSSAPLEDLEDEDINNQIQMVVAELVRTGVIDAGGTEARSVQPAADPDGGSEEEEQGGEQEGLGGEAPEAEQAEGPGEEEGPDWLLADS